MIYVSPINNDYYNGFIVEGHADYAERGYDVVCASMSASVYTTHNILAFTTPEHMLEAIFQSGYSKVLICTPDERTDAVMDGFVAFCQQVEKQYPSYVMVKGDCNHAEQRIPRSK